MVDMIVPNVKLDVSWICVALLNDSASAVFGDPIYRGDKDFEGVYKIQVRNMSIIKSKLEPVTAKQNGSLVVLSKKQHFFLKVLTRCMFDVIISVHYH